MIHLPTLNACLNGLAGMFLLLGGLAIRAKNPQRHKRFMTAAFVCSALFLISYLTYHIQAHGMVTRYQGEGVLRIVYFGILLTHTPLAALVVPFAIAAVVFALKGQYQRHVKITRWLLPVWLYVSVTGVLIYWMLYVL